MSCIAPIVTMTFGPDTLSCSGTTTTSKLLSGTFGFWSCTVKVAPFAARRTAIDRAIDRRPTEMSTRGQGGARSSPSLPSAANGAVHRPGGSQRHGARGAIRLITGSSPIMRESPAHWFSIPTEPSVTTQQVGVCLLTYRLAARPPSLSLPLKGGGNPGSVSSIGARHRA